MQPLAPTNLHPAWAKHQHCCTVHTWCYRPANKTKTKPVHTAGQPVNNIYHFCSLSTVDYKSRQRTATLRSFRTRTLFIVSDLRMSAQSQITYQPSLSTPVPVGETTASTPIKFVNQGSQLAAPALQLTAHSFLLPATCLTCCAATTLATGAFNAVAHTSSCHLLLHLLLEHSLNHLAAAVQGQLFHTHQHTWQLVG